MSHHRHHPTIFGQPVFWVLFSGSMAAVTAASLLHLI